MKKPLLVFVGAFALFGVSLVTDHWGNFRHGANNAEDSLTPALLQSGNFGRACTLNVDGDVYAQPLFVPAVTGIGGRTARNVLIVATQHNSLYAFDADGCGPEMWKTNFGGNQPGSSYPGHVGDLIYQRETGCRATPAVDPVGGIIYSVCSSASQWVLRKTSITDGSTLATQTISATVSGVTFCPLCQSNTSGATLANGNIYVTFGSMSDQTDHGNWYGWVIGYAQSDLSQIGAFCTTCAGGQAKGGIWHSGGGPSVDLSGNLYVITGNGGGTPAVGNLPVSVIKLGPTLSLLDWYAPTTYATLNANDWDLSTGRPMLTSSGALLTFGAKDFNVYALNTGCLGNIGGTLNGCTAPQVFATGSGSPTDHQGIYGGVFSSPLSTAFFPNTAGSVYAFSLSGTTWNTTPTIGANTYEFPGAQLTASCSSAGTNCIVWATVPVSASALFSAQPSKLVAMNPATLAEYWSSTGKSPDGVVGNLAKLTIPTIANGRVYVGTLGSGIAVYGDTRSRFTILGN